MREDALDFRKKAEEEILQKQLEDKQLTLSSYNAKKEKLCKWVGEEVEQISKFKKDIYRGYLSTTETIKRTQSDILYMKKMF